MTIAAFGEVMLRLTVPDYLLMEQTDRLQMSFTGTGVNILTSLAHFGEPTRLLSALPANRLGQTAASAIRRLGVNDQQLIFRGDHLGSFFVELGYGNRPEQVTYQNRLASAFGTSQVTDYAINASLKDVDWLHICGISLSLTDGSRETAFAYAEAAARKDITVCFDFNYRIALNRHNGHAQMRDYYVRMLKSSQLVFGSRRDLTDLMDYPKDQPDDVLFPRFLEDYQLKAFAGTRRVQREGKDYLQGFICDERGLHWSAEQQVMILDRIGGGDAFAAGIIEGYLQGWSPNQQLTFATANAALAHAQVGDSPLATREQVDAFIASNGATGSLVR